MVTSFLVGPASGWVVVVDSDPSFRAVDPVVAVVDQTGPACLDLDSDFGSALTAVDSSLTSPSCTVSPINFGSSHST